MEILSLTPDKIEDWNRFCFESDDAWFWHTSGWLAYQLEYGIKNNPVNRSFVVIRNNEIIAICPLIEQDVLNVREFCYAGQHGPNPAFLNTLKRKEKNKVIKVVYEHIDKLAKEYGVKRCLLGYPVLNKSVGETCLQNTNDLLKFGYLDNSLITRVIDLRESIEGLSCNVRHGHKYDIKRIENILQIDFFDHNTLTKKIFETYMNLHKKAAGRVTRNNTTFDMMYNFVKNGHSFLVAASKGGAYVGFSYFYFYKKNVYYGSSCNDPDYSEMPISHAIQWATIKKMHEYGCVLYEIGWQYYGHTLVSSPSQKEINISRFKRGFGGADKMYFMGEKYYDSNYFVKLHKDRIDEYTRIN